MNFREKIMEYFRKFIKWIAGSADNDPGGASSKKLTMFWVVVVVITPLCYIYAWDQLRTVDKALAWRYLPEILLILSGLVTGTVYFNVKDKKQQLDGSNNDTP